jgi:lysophospholipase L1-like esterase
MPTLGGSTGGGGGGDSVSVDSDGSLVINGVTVELASDTQIATLEASLGTAATKDVGVLAGDVAAADDARLGQGGPSYGLKPENFSRWRKAMSRVRTGEADAKILCIGDSITQGETASVGTNPTYRNCWPKRLQEFLNAYYVPAQVGLCTGGYGDAALDTRFTLGSGWSWAAANVGFAKHSIQSAGGASGTLTYQPGYPCDTADIYYKQHNSNQGNSSVTVDGGAPTTLTGFGTPSSVKKTTISLGALASNHSLVFAGASGGAGLSLFDIFGIDCYDSTTTRVRVGLAGRSGASTADWGFGGFPGAGFQSLDCIAAYAPHLSIINLGVNDAAVPISLSTYIANMAAVIQVCQLSGDVLLTGCIPSGLTFAGRQPTELSYSRDGLSSLASDYDCGVVDLNARWVDYATADANGWMTDGLHPTAAGYADMGQAIFNALKTI